FMTDFTAQMQAVFGPRMPLVGGMRNSLHHFGQLQQALSLRVDVPNRECVENRSDTRSDDLRIVRQYRIFRWPVYARTWIHVFFKVIGMQLDQPRNNEIALPVFGGRQRAPALAYIMDLAVTQGH